MRANLPGLHTTYKRKSTGVTIYAYAYRGGPLVAKATGIDKSTARRKLEKELGTASAVEAIASALRKPSATSERSGYLSGLVSAFKASPEFQRLSADTKTAYGGYLDGFKLRFGEWKVVWFERPQARQRICAYRDEWSHQPRTADYIIQAIRRLFSWARGRGLTNADPTDGIEKLHRANRSDRIWTASDLAKLEKHASCEVYLATRLASLTGLRTGDLLRLRWSDIKETHIAVVTGKRSRQVFIAIDDETRSCLDKIEKKGPFVLTNSKGMPWTSDGFKTSFRKAKIAAGIEGLRFHDLRGTAATNLAAAGLSNEEIAMMIGWSRSQVEAMVQRYVNRESVVVDIARRMNQKRAATNQ